VLVRALVVGEACVAVDAHHGFVGGADVFGREGFHAGVDLFDESKHGIFEFPLVDVFAWGEPLAVVVLGEATEKLEGLWGEVSCHRSLMLLERALDFEQA